MQVEGYSFVIGMEYVWGLNYLPSIKDYKCSNKGYQIEQLHWNDNEFRRQVQAIQIST